MQGQGWLPARGGGRSMSMAISTPSDIRTYMARRTTPSGNFVGWLPGRRRRTRSMLSQCLSVSLKSSMPIFSAASAGRRVQQFPVTEPARPANACVMCLTRKTGESTRPTVVAVVTVRESAPNERMSPMPVIAGGWAKSASDATARRPSARKPAAASAGLGKSTVLDHKVLWTCTARPCSSNASSSSTSCSAGLAALHCSSPPGRAHRSAHVHCSRSSGVTAGST
mmetsp:Transcript_79538/g.251272  ORF Transcript_79538/g.251272 Transcript_79538/m.251272 type:complete len:225 (+) Transcript_79538:2134-2808(+)